MAGSFLGLSIAASGLLVNQRALSVNAHNIANANTEGYSRQRMDMTQFRPDMLPGGLGSLGTGVDVTAVKQFRDEFMDFRFQQENTVVGEWTKKEDILLTLEALFNEPSESGIATVVDEFFSSLQELSKSPELLETRALVRQRAIMLAENLSHLSEGLHNLQQDMNFQLETAVNEVNSLADQIAELNSVIFESELEGGVANDLRDQRSLLVDKLSEYAELQTFTDNQNRFFVQINGTLIVSHIDSQDLVLTERADKKNPDDVARLTDLSWEKGGTFVTSGGALKGIMDMRDGATAESKGIPYYVEKLNEFADTFISEMNRVHSSGYDLDQNTGTSLFTVNDLSSADYENAIKTSGLDGNAAIDLTTVLTAGTSSSNTEAENQEIIRKNTKTFFANNPNYDGKSVKVLSDGRYYLSDRLRASDITISKDVDSDLDKIAASSTPTGVPGAGDNALKLNDLRQDSGMFAWGSPEDFVRSLVSNLGVDAQEAKRIVSNQEAMMKQIEFFRQSAMGVSIDEEMADMIRFQNAYNASARMLTTIDEMLDLIINRLGTVGR